MKILFYAARIDEQEAIQAWEHTHSQTQIDTTADILDEKSVYKAEGYDAIVVQQHIPISSPVIYEQLAVFGIHHIALRITGYEIINFEAAAAAGIVVTNVPGYSPRSVAENALMHTMVLLRHFKKASRRMDQNNFSIKGLEAFEIHNLTVGVIGVGRIGSTSAQIFHALGARVLGYDIQNVPENVNFESVSLNELLTSSDVITIHTTLNKTSFHLIGTKELAQMKTTALLINCARGDIIDTNALIKALETHQIAGAGIDTVEGDTQIFGSNLNQMQNQSQNLQRIQKLLAFENVTVTPHSSFYTDEAVKNMVDIALDDIWAIQKHQTSPHIVNPIISGGK